MSSEQELMLPFVSIFLSILVAFLLGRKRQIGFWWSLFFGFTLNPFISLIISQVSGKITDPNPEFSIGKLIYGITLLVVGLLFGSALFGDVWTEDEKYQVITIGIGLFGGGIYVLKRIKYISWQLNKM